MFTINIDKESGCFKRSMNKNNQGSHDKDTALIEATAMLSTMNEEFGKKHEFALAENGNTFQITMTARPQQAQADAAVAGNLHKHLSCYLSKY
jgi:hypothetical protein